ncbi:MAG: sigma-70 family RNA polymerase sigma factor [Phycisphaerae bacterium]|nr:sigma-70 family RNA polymerase sigma factor [Phycisphaerae bacterium]NIP50677.1 sigma-70 family RNA polymerase sigma factor [Phycisphaerae bacterium]NIS52362.1 sigma-70 family RNA polymerase sigma factor [Phycisphaerae bacterium]NIU11923.1 sigma-70 family RNA polymerase sigma factor [Phycisphaerae bacterium]NIU57568.1 sigma-70 family RNA polymerase sigma factor [Phycisphaerae bacterium]
MTLETVIHRVLEGDVESFRFILQRYELPVVRMIKNITNSADASEDIAQDVFLTAYKKLASFDPARSNFSTWLFTIARNKSLNAIKRKKPLLIGDLPEKGSPRNPSDDMARKEFYDRLDQTLQALPSRQRSAFILAEFEKLPYEEIAQIEGTRLGTIKSRINRAKKKLRTDLIEFGGDMV